MNPYTLLGVSQYSSPDKIKRAFRKMALKHHPDRSKDSGEMFMKVNEAYLKIKDRPFLSKVNDLFSCFAQKNKSTIDIMF